MTDDKYRGEDLILHVDRLRVIHTIYLRRRREYVEYGQDRCVAANCLLFEIKRDIRKQLKGLNLPDRDMDYSDEVSTPQLHREFYWASRDHTVSFFLTYTTAIDDIDGISRFCIQGEGPGSWECETRIFKAAEVCSAVDYFVEVVKSTEEHKA